MSAPGTTSYKAAGNGSEAATWSLAGLAPGLYRVSITWEPYFNRSVDAPFAVYDGTFLLGTARVNQQAVPGSFVEGGTRWYDQDHSVSQAVRSLFS